MNVRDIEIRFFFGLLAAIGLLVGLIFWSYLMALFLALTLAIIFYPLRRRIDKFVHRSDSFAAFLTLAVILVIVITPLIILGFQVAQEAINLYWHIASGAKSSSFFAEPIIDVLHAWFPQLDMAEISISVTQVVRQVVGWLFQNLGLFFSGLTGFLLKGFLAIIALYYFLKDGERLRLAAIRLLPTGPENTEKILNRLRIAIESVIRGTLVVAVAQGVLAGFGYYLFGVPSAAFWGSLTIVAALIPVVGTSIVVFPAVAYLILTGSLAPALGLAIWGTFLVGIVDNFLRPWLLKQSVDIHPLLILLSVMGGIEFFGPAGFLAGPVILSLFFALLDIYPSLVQHESTERRTV